MYEHIRFGSQRMADHRSVVLEDGFVTSGPEHLEGKSRDKLMAHIKDNELAISYMSGLMEHLDYGCIRLK